MDQNNKDLDTSESLKYKFTLVITTIAFVILSFWTGNSIKNNKYESQVKVLKSNIAKRDSVIMINDNIIINLESSIKFRNRIIDTLTNIREEILDSMANNLITYEDLDSTQQITVEQEALNYVLSHQDNEK